MVLTVKLVSLGRLVSLGKLATTQLLLIATKFPKFLKLPNPNC